jgi:GT2 family glycosyltransferase
METINKEIGVFILNYNGIYWLKKNLSNIISHSINAAIIVIDNNSTDGSVQYINDHFPSIELKINNKNYGF